MKLRSFRLRSAVVARVVRLGLVALFVSAVARHWDPHHGFTRFLQADTATASVSVPVFHEAGAYVHSDPGSYDGNYYAQIATDPTLRTPELRSAIDDLGYRARRILLPVLAWTVAGGDPAGAIRAFAWLNILVWLGLAALLWRLFPVEDWRGTIAWTGLLFATGSLLNVRLALPDLAALALTAAAVCAWERRRPGRAAVALALAALARETALLGAVAFLPRAIERGRSRWSGVPAAMLAALPLGCWLIYVRVVVGSSGAGLNNFNWPLVGLGKKTAAIASAFSTEPNRWLVIGSLCAIVALVAQLLYVVLRPARDDPWWRIGAAYGVLMLFLGHAVWGEDLPGAAVRVLLPLGLAFNVLAVRRRAALPWLIAGNLWIVGAPPVLGIVPRNADELATGRLNGGSYLVRTNAEWHLVEARGSHRWVWSAHGGQLTVGIRPRASRPLDVTLTLSAFTPREIEIRHEGNTLWRGEVRGKNHRVALPPLRTDAAGRLTLELSSRAEPLRENSGPQARLIGFAVSDVHVGERQNE